MSTLYEVGVTIRGYAKDREDEIHDALMKEGLDTENAWSMEDPKEGPTEYGLSSEVTMGGLYAPSDCAKDIAKAVVEANGAPCEVEVTVTCLENLPYDTFTFGEEETRALLGAERSEE